MKRKGFTYIEIIIVITLITILSTIVIVVVDPNKKIATTNNTKRMKDIDTIANAVNQCAINGRGGFPIQLPDVPTVIGSEPDQIDLCNYLVPTYIAEIPFDPTAQNAHYTNCTDYNAGYEIYFDSSNSRITISAKNAELGDPISLSK